MKRKHGMFVGFAVSATIVATLAAIFTLMGCDNGNSDGDPPSVEFVANNNPKVGDTLEIIYHNYSGQRYPYWFRVSSDSADWPPENWMSLTLDELRQYGLFMRGPEEYILVSVDTNTYESNVGKYFRVLLSMDGKEYRHTWGPVTRGSSSPITISPTSATVAKGGTKSFTVTVSGTVSTSDVTWTVTPSDQGGTIPSTGSGTTISGGSTSINNTLTVASDATASALTVTATCNGQSASATVTVQ